MQKSPNSLVFFLCVAGFGMASHGIFVLGQSSVDSANLSEWRRTSIGWEQAESLPIRTNELLGTSEIQFPSLSITTETIHQTHRLALPLAITGFMVCLGPWLLLRWPTPQLPLFFRDDV